MGAPRSPIVLGESDRLKMRWIDAGSVAAKVVDL